MLNSNYILAIWKWNGVYYLMVYICAGLRSPGWHLCSVKGRRTWRCQVGFSLLFSVLLSCRDLLPICVRRFSVCILNFQGFLFVGLLPYCPSSSYFMLLLKPATPGVWIQRNCALALGFFFPFPQPLITSHSCYPWPELTQIKPSLPWKDLRRRAVGQVVCAGNDLHLSLGMAKKEMHLG